MAGALSRLTRERNERIEVGWLTARLTAYAPQKSRDFQKLDKLLIGGTAAAKRQSWQQQLALSSNWT